jgi:hypothetical protein
MTLALAIISKHFGVPQTEMYPALEQFWDRDAATELEIPPPPARRAPRARRRPSVSQAIEAAERAGKTVIVVNKLGKASSSHSPGKLNHRKHHHTGTGNYDDQSSPSVHQQLPRPAWQASVLLS